MMMNDDDDDDDDNNKSSIAPSSRNFKGSDWRIIGPDETFPKRTPIRWSSTRTNGFWSNKERKFRRSVIAPLWSFWLARLGAVLAVSCLQRPCDYRPRRRWLSSCLIVFRAPPCSKNATSVCAMKHNHRWKLHLISL